MCYYVTDWYGGIDMLGVAIAGVVLGAAALLTGGALLVLTLKNNKKPAKEVPVQNPAEFAKEEKVEPKEEEVAEKKHVKEANNKEEENLEM